MQFVSVSGKRCVPSVPSSKEATELNLNLSPFQGYIVGTTWNPWGLRPRLLTSAPFGGDTQCEKHSSRETALMMRAAARMVVPAARPVVVAVRVTLM